MRKRELITATVLLLLLSGRVHASFLSPELEDKLATFIAQFVLFVVPIVLIGPVLDGAHPSGEDRAQAAPPTIRSDSHLVPAVARLWRTAVACSCGARYSRKASAPSHMARTLEGMSPRPVRNRIGSGLCARADCDSGRSCPASNLPLRAVVGVRDDTYSAGRLRMSNTEPHDVAHGRPPARFGPGASKGSS